MEKYRVIRILTTLFLIPAAAHTHASGASGEARQTPPFATVAVVPFVVEPQQFPGVPNRPDQDRLVQRLAEEATARAARSLVRQQIAGTVERVPSRDTTAAVLVVGTVRMPVSLPPYLHGLRAQMRHGRFVTANVVIQLPDGTIRARDEATLNWGDIRWAYGAKFRQDRPLDPILEEFVRKVVDRAIKGLREHNWTDAPGKTIQHGNAAPKANADLPCERSSVGASASAQGAEARMTSATAAGCCGSAGAAPGRAPGPRKAAGVTP